MTKDEVKEFAKVLNAYAEGKTIQMRIDDTWEDFRGLGEIMFNAGHKNYRVKPNSLKYKKYLAKYTGKLKIYIHHEEDYLTPLELERAVSFIKWLDDDWIEQEV